MTNEAGLEYLHTDADRKAALDALDEADECFQPETLEELRNFFPVFRLLLSAARVPIDADRERAKEWFNSHYCRSECAHYKTIIDALSAPRVPVDSGGLKSIICQLRSCFSDDSSAYGERLLDEIWTLSAPRVPVIPGLNYACNYVEHPLSRIGTDFGWEQLCKVTRAARWVAELQKGV